MVKKLVLLTSFILYSIIGRANVDFIITLYGKHVKISTVVGMCSTPEAIPKLDILIKVLENYNKQYFNDSIYFYIDLNSIYRDSLGYYDMSYDSTLFIADSDVKYYGQKLEEELHQEMHKAIHLKYAEPYINPVLCIKLLDFGIYNTALINSYQQVRKKLNFDSNWVVITNADRIINSKTDWQLTLIKEREFSRRNFIRNEDSVINYYYQNDSFYIYKVDKPDKILLTTRDIYRIECQNNNCLLFENDSNFYHLRLKDNTIIGPYLLPYYYNRSSCRRIDSISINNNEMSIKVNGIDDYVAIIDFVTKRVKIDSSSVDEHTRLRQDYVQRLQKKEQAKADEYNNRKKNIMLMAAFFASLTIILIAYQKKR